MEGGGAGRDTFLSQLRCDSTEGRRMRQRRGGGSWGSWTRADRVTGQGMAPQGLEIAAHELLQLLDSTAA